MISLKAPLLTHLARNLDEETRRTKCPPGTPRFQELDDERTLLRATQAMAPPLRIPLDLRLTEEELRRREMEKTLEKLSHVVADLVEDEDMNAAVEHIKDRLNNDEAAQTIAGKQKDGEGQISSSGKEESSVPNEGQSNPGYAPLPVSDQQFIDTTGKENEEASFVPSQF